MIFRVTNFVSSVPDLTLSVVKSYIDNVTFGKLLGRKYLVSLSSYNFRGLGSLTKVFVQCLGHELLCSDLE